MAKIYIEYVCQGGGTRPLPPAQETDIEYFPINYDLAGKEGGKAEISLQELISPEPERVSPLNHRVQPLGVCN